MIDIIKEFINLVEENEPFMQLLGGNKKSLYRTRAPNAISFPRIEFALLDDADGDYYDNQFASYSADIQVSIYKKDTELFELGKLLNDIFSSHSFDRVRHLDQFDYSVDAYVKIMVFRGKVQLKESGFKWLERS